MKIPIKIREDEYFVRQVKNLIIQRVNELLKDSTNLETYLREIIDKRIERIMTKLIMKIAIPKHKLYPFEKKEGFEHYLKDLAEKKVTEFIANYFKNLFMDENNLIKSLTVILKNKKELNFKDLS